MMCSTHHKILLFGDQTVETLSTIQALFQQSKSSPTLSRFLRDAADTVRTEACGLNPTDRDRFPDFENVVDLAEGYDKLDRPDELLATVLMCIAQLGELIIRAEGNNRVLASSSDSKIHIIGLCTGLLPAAVAATSHDSSDIIHLGGKIVAVAFRLGYQLSARSKQIEPESGCWGYSIMDVPAQEQRSIMESFHRDKQIPIHRNAYISVETETWTTISGPPSVLEDLFAYSLVLRNATTFKLPFSSPAHAPHLERPDYNSIIGSSSWHDLNVKVNTRVMSTSTCVPFSGKKLGELLHQITDDIFEHLLDLSGTVQGVLSDIDVTDEVQLCVIGPTSQLGMVKRTLESQGIEVALDSPADIANADSNLIAITGMSGRFPGAENLEQFWETLQAGENLYKEIPKSRFNIKTHFDASGQMKNASTVPYGCFLENPGAFDNRLFNISPREAEQMDPIQRLALMTSYEALEHAGYTQNATPSTNSRRISTYFGQAAEDWGEVNASQDVDVYFIPATLRAFTPGRVNYHYKWGGASYSLDSACASSSTAVLLACKALLARDCDMALAGGGSILTSVTKYAGLSRAGFLSSTGSCKTFSDKADGYCRGEGVGVVVLKRLRDAIADNDHIRAVIRGGARNFSSDAVSITNPSAEAQQRLFKGILQNSGVESEEVGFVEMHGTATQAGDLAEMTSVTKVLGKNRRENNPLGVGAVKANVGHGEAAAGITSLIKSILMLKENTIPAQPQIQLPLNHKFPVLDEMNIRIAKTASPFKASSRNKDGKRKIMVNNFDASGGNTCLLIEDAPTLLPKSKQDPRTFHTVVVSARTSQSLCENRKRLLQYISAHPDISLADVAYTTTARRMHETLRQAYPAESIQDLVGLLNTRTNLSIVEAPSTSPRMVWSFTGQGSAYAGMGKDLFATSPRFNGTVLKLQQICSQHGFPEFVDLISQHSTNLSTKSTVQIQLALVSLEIALADLWKSWGLQPALVIGHSLGEYAALCVSGVLSVSDTLYLVGKRATMIQENCTRGYFAMLAVGLSCSLVETQLEMYPTCTISCINGPESTVVSGPVADIEILQEQLRINDCRSSLLKVPFGFHSAQINPIITEFQVCAQGVHFAKPKIPVASTLEGSIITDSGVFNATYLARQAREPVNFVGALEASKSTDLGHEETIWLEIGPNPVCLGMIRSTLGVPSSRLIASLRKDDDNWKTVATAVASKYALGAPISWTDFHKDYVQSLKLLDIPTYAFDLKDFWIQYSGDWALKHLKSNSETPKPISGPVIPGFPTTTVQGIESESFTDSSVSITFYSLIGQPDLLHAIQGHVVNGISLCPSSIFVDMAYTTAKYIYQRVNPGKDTPSMAVSSLEINHPLIPRLDSPEQTLLITATKSSAADWQIEVTFASKEGPSLQKHGSCSVTFEKAADWESNWSKTSYFIKTARDAIVNIAKAGAGHRLLKPIVYKLFANFVVYRSDYQAIDEVFLENEFGDAVANLKLKPLSGNSKFTFNPYWMDAIIHVAGFVLNGNVQNPDDVVYISTGFSALRINKDLDENKSYTSYVHLQETDEKGNTTSDVYVFDGDRIIGLCAGLTFQRLKRDILTAIFENSISSGSHAMATKQGKEYQVQERQIAEIPTGDTTSSHSRSSRETGSDTPGSFSSVSSIVDDEEDESELVITAVAEQTGFSKEEMLPTTRFADMGLDSLMSMEIIKILKKKSGMVLPAAFFNHNPTVADARRLLAKAPEPNVVPLATTTSKWNPMSKAVQQISKSNILPAKIYESNVILLQGRPSSKETPLFLITDGAGSATSYIHLPAFSSGLPLYALESPFLHDPTAFTCGITDVADIYIAAIRKTRPHGPYLIGGWSAGSAYAYEVSRKLLEMNEEIKGLILLDMHLPKKVSDLVTPNMELLELTGLTAGVDRAGFSMARMSNTLKEHLLSTMKALVDYEPVPMHPSRRPLRTFIIWARKGLTEVLGEAPPIFDKIAADKAVKSETKAWLFGDDDQEDDVDTGMLAWFYGKRTNFGPNGWERMVGDNVDTFVVDCDHFSIVNPPYVEETGMHLQTIITKCAAL